MKKFINLTILSFILISIQFLYATEMVILSFQGSVEILQQGEKDWKKVKTGVILKTGDKIRTGKKSQAVTVSKEGHKITIKQNTSFLISKLGPVEWDFEQEIGKAHLWVAKLGAGQSLKVKTPTAVCAVRGTEFEVTVLEDKSTVLDVFSGVVGLMDIEGVSPEISVIENQRSVVEEGMSPRTPEAIPETEREREERMEEGRKPERFMQDFRQEIAREISFDLERENIEAAAAFEMQASQYQEAKTLIDAFGKRVRLEEYITRPTPDSFKFVSLNTREERFDFGFFEVVANKKLPEDLNAAGNLWFATGETKPEFYATKQRWFVTNTRDSVAEINLDGDSKQITFTEPIFTEDGQFVDMTRQTGWQTVFDHKYEFINGNPTALEKIWNDASFRPKDNGMLAGIHVTGMMWHMRPIKMDMSFTDPNTGLTTVSGSFYQDVFMTNTANNPGDPVSAGGVGKQVVKTFEPDPDSFKAHFTEKISYINFVDTSGNGYYDAGEPVFSDLNRNGTLDAGEPSGTDPFVVAQKPWAWQTGENFVIDDFGKVLNLRDAGFSHLAEGSQDKNAVADLFEKVNFERVWKSSEFGNPANSIDIVMTPRIFIKAGLIGPTIR